MSALTLGEGQKAELKKPVWGESAVPVEKPRLCTALNQEQAETESLTKRKALF
jgi:hypothetical protein